MSEPIKLPPLTVATLMDVFGSHADIPPALLSAQWKDGIDVDVTSMRAQMLVETYAGLAVEQATAELRAERDALLALLTTAGLARAQEEHNKVRAERDELRALLLRIRGWDMIDVSANGAFWRRKIDAAVKEASDADA